MEAADVRRPLKRCRGLFIGAVDSHLGPCSRRVRSREPAPRRSSACRTMPSGGAGEGGRAPGKRTDAQMVESEPNCTFLK